MNRDVVIFGRVVVAVVLDRGQLGMDIGRTSGGHLVSALWICGRIAHHRKHIFERRYTGLAGFCSDQLCFGQLAAGFASRTGSSTTMTIDHLESA